MSANHPPGIKFQQDLLSEAAEGVTPAEADLSAIRRLAVCGLAGVLLVLVLAPALIAGVSLVDGRLADQAAGWFRWPIGLAPFLRLGSWGSTMALVGIVMRAGEDQ